MTSLRGKTALATGSSKSIGRAIALEFGERKANVVATARTASEIEDEVMSQVGTRLTCLLDNDRDIDAVLGGAAGSRELRSVLSRLESTQQALIFGHAVPMPVVVHTREYGSPSSYEELSRTTSRRRRDDGKPPTRSPEEEIKDLF